MILQPNNLLPEQSGMCFDFHRLDSIGVKIENLTTDSRMVNPGETFLAYGGERQDGRRFIPEAIAAGANAVIWESDSFEWNNEWKVPALTR